MDMVGMTIKTCLNCILTHTVPSQSEGVFWCAVFSRFVVVFRLRRAGVFHLRCAGMLCLRCACGFCLRCRGMFHLRCAGMFRL